MDDTKSLKEKEKADLLKQISEAKKSADGMGAQKLSSLQAQLSKL